MLRITTESKLTDSATSSRIEIDERELDDEELPEQRYRRYLRQLRGEASRGRIESPAPDAVRKETTD